MLSRKNFEIADQNRRLENYNADLEQFAYIVSHNLREPLRTVGNYASLLKRRLAGKLPEDETRFLGFINWGVNHMHAILSNLLVYVKLGKDEFKPQRVDMNEVVFHAMEQLSDEIRDSGAQISVQPMPSISGNKEGLDLIFYHILSNAIKFRGDTPLQVWIDYAPSGGYHQFSFQDNGIGMKEEYTGKIFNIFQRLHTYESYSGSGIGLAICQKVVQQHKGWISASSEPGVGTTIEVHLPIIV